ncbi:MFS transporter [Actinokineospora guangxiensis]|uniref:MFS transporter n=1 Tax=Actinokineospora guangxiensis TaxID=1490288 RepID=A0ABW0EGT1_9PSEU
MAHRSAVRRTDPAPPVPDPGAPPGAPPGNWSLWRDRRTVGWAVATGVSTLGDEIWFVALAFTAAGLGNAGLAGFVLACATIPRALLMLLGGALTDRFDARRMMLVADLARIAVLAVGLLVFATAGVSPWLLIAVSLAFGAADAFYGPAATAFPRQLVPKSELGRVAALRQLLGRGAWVLGAPLGGLVMVSFGFGGAMVVDLISFAVVLVVVVLVRPRWPRERSAGRSVRADVGDGLRYLATTPRVRDLVITLSGLNVFVAPVLSIGVALHVTGEGWGAVSLGWLTGAVGAGAALGTLVALRWRPARPLVSALLILLVQAASLTAIGWAPFAVTLAATFLVGATAGLASPLLAGVVQASVDDAYIGRVSSVLALADNGFAPLTMVGFGAIAQVFGLASTTAAFGACFAALVLFALSRKHVRALDTTASTDAPGTPENQEQTR